MPSIVNATWNTRWLTRSGKWDDQVWAFRRGGAPVAPMPGKHDTVFVPGGMQLDLRSYTGTVHVYGIIIEAFSLTWDGHRRRLLTAGRFFLWSLCHPVQRWRIRRAERAWRDENDWVG